MLIHGASIKKKPRFETVSENELIFAFSWIFIWSQKNLAWVGPPEATQSCLLLRAGLVAAGCSGPCPGWSWALVRTEMSHLLWVPVPVSPPLWWEKLPALRVLPVVSCPVTARPWEKSGSVFSGLSPLRRRDSNVVSLTLLFSTSPRPSASRLHPLLQPPACLGGPTLDSLQRDTLSHKLGKPVWTWSGLTSGI